MRRIKHGVKLLARGSERWAAAGVALEVTAASAGAISAVEARGGSVVSVYRTPLALRAHLRPHRFATPIRSPRPPPGKMAYYTAWRSRGYLSSAVQLAALRKRLAEGGHPAPSMLMPVFAGGAPPGGNILLDIELDPAAALKAAPPTANPSG